MSSEVEETLKRLVSHKGKIKSIAGLALTSKITDFCHFNLIWAVFQLSKVVSLYWISGLRTVTLFLLDENGNENCPTVCAKGFSVTVVPRPTLSLCPQKT